MTTTQTAAEGIARLYLTSIRAQDKAFMGGDQRAEAVAHGRVEALREALNLLTGSDPDTQRLLNSLK